MFPEGRALEFLIVAVVALVVVGPKDLPVLLRKLGQWMAKLRGMANEFRASFDEMARQSELDDLRKEVEAMRKGQYADVAARAADVQIGQTFDDIHQSLTSPAYQYAEPGAAPLPLPEPEPAPAPAKVPRARKASAKALAAPQAKPAAPASKAPARPKAAPPRAGKRAEPKA